MQFKIDENTDMAALKQAFWDKGYAHLKGFVDPDSVREVATQARSIFAAQMKQSGIRCPHPETSLGFSQGMFQLFKKDPQGFMNCGKLAQHMISLHRLALSERLVNLVKSLGQGFPTISTRPVMYFNSRHVAKSEGYWKSPPHQDWRSIQGSLNSIVIWIPLVDIDIPLGALEIVAGSHKLGLFDSTEDDWYRTIDPEVFGKMDFVPVETVVGDALVFSTFLVHRSGNNTTEDIRWSCHFRYNDAEEKTFLERKFPNPYAYGPTRELLTPGFPEVELLVKTFKELSEG